MAKKGNRRRPGITAKVLLLLSAASLAVFLLLNALLPYLFVYTLQDNAIRNDRARNKLVMAQLDSILTYVDNTGMSMRFDRNLETLIRADRDEGRTQPSDELQRALGGYVTNSFGRIVTAMVDVGDGRVYADGLLTAGELALLEEDWYLEFLHSDAKRAYSDVFLAEFSDAEGRGSGQRTVLAIAMRYTGPQGTGGTIVLVCSLASIVQTCTYQLDIEGTDYVLLDTQDNVFYPVGEQRVEAGHITGVVAGLEGRSHVVKDADGYTLVETSRHGDIKLVTRNTREALLLPYRPIINFVSLIVLAALLLLFLAMAPTIAHTLRPLRRLSDSMGQVATGNFETELDVHTGDEVEELARSFNDMSQQLQRYFDALQLQKAEQERLRLQLIVAQLSPHFIYNTMNTITYLANKGKTEDVIKVNSMLIGILRDRLRIDDINIHCPVAEEIRIIDQYAVIQSYRYGPVFEIVWDVPGELMEHSIPKYILQPLVENALFHGLLPNKEANGDVVGGVIRVGVRCEGATTRLCVEDNGRGMDAATQARLSEVLSLVAPSGTQSIGLQNVANRLHMLYGENAHIALSREGGWTRFCIEFSRGE